ncbi:MAG: DNA-3-methyladenine glycosylase [Thermoleophilales bacterium]|nr:DNA-3-methyladenine glycosylase [Thermoleophilales bacterium]
MPATAVIEQDVRPIGPYRLPPARPDGVMRRRGSALTRVIHLGDEPAVVRAWPVAGAVRVQARGPSPEAAAYAVERMRFALNLDHDLRPFHDAFKHDPLIGPIIRRYPWLRPLRRAIPFEALAWAVTEQLIETTRAFAIQRRLTYRYGRRSACGTLRDAPTPAVLAARAPYELAALDLAAKRATALIKVSREIDRGRVDLNDHEPAWKRLLTIPNIGSWTIDCLAFHGQGRDDMLPAGDLAYVKLVGRLARLGRRATEGEVREFFRPYGEWAGLAGTYMLRAASDRPYLRAA